MFDDEKGLTIVEMLAVLTIGTLVALISFKLALSHFLKADVVQTRINVGNILEATNSFFESNCSQGLSPQPTINSLVSAGFLSSSEFSTNSFGSDFSPQIVWGNMTQSTRIIVSSTLPPNTNVESRALELGANRYSGNTIFWDSTPSIFARQQGQENIHNLQFHFPERCR